jgi:hypothetical protein
MKCAVHKVQKDHLATNIQAYLNHWLITAMTEQKSTSKQLASDSVCVVDATIDAIQPCVLNKD